MGGCSRQRQCVRSVTVAPRPGRFADAAKAHLIQPLRTGHRIGMRSPVRQIPARWRIPGPPDRHPEDITQGVMLALTNTFLTGQTLHIDGGEPLT
jgi:NAD(P)-dependent dehydrogenase (short-subunit alcohol dehydrogenase family)